MTQLGDILSAQAHPSSWSLLDSDRPEARTDAELRHRWAERLADDAHEQAWGELWTS